MSEDIKTETTHTEEHSLVQQNPQLDAEKQVDARSQPTEVRPDADVEEVDQRANPGSPQAHDLSTSAAILGETKDAEMRHAASGLPTTLPTIETEALDAAATMPAMPDEVIDSKASKAMSTPERISERDKFIAAARAFFMRNNNCVNESQVHAAFDEAHLMSLKSSGHVVSASMVDRTYQWIDADPVAQPVVDEAADASAPGPLDSNDAAG